MFSMMASAPAQHSWRAPLMTAEEAHAFVAGPFGGSPGTGGGVLSLGIPALDQALPFGGLAFGSVTELQVHGTGGAATSFALSVCRAAQSFEPSAACGLAEGKLGNWCAFVDPSRTLFAPGVANLGVDLDRLLVVHPQPEDVGRVAVRIAEAKIATVIVIDLSEVLCFRRARGMNLGASSNDEAAWQRTIRRLSLAIRSTQTCILVITRAARRQSLPFPTFLRLQFTRTSAEAFELRVTKERTGRVFPSRTIAWAELESMSSSATAGEEMASREMVPGEAMLEPVAVLDRAAANVPKGARFERTGSIARRMAQGLLQEVS